MTKYGIIDFSSSALSLLVARINENDNETIFNDRRSISTLDYIDKEGKLNNRGIQKIIDYYGELIQCCRNMNVSRIYAISTAGLREIKNYKEVSETIEEKTKLKVTVIDGKTEAFADYMANERYTILSAVALIDIGGASTELCDFAKANKDDMHSLPIGALSLQKEFVSEVYPTIKEVQAIKERIRHVIEKYKLPKEKCFDTAIMAGANATGLYRIYADYFNLPVKPDSEKIIETKRLKKLAKHLVTSPDRSMLIIKNTPEKVHMMIPAAIIAKELLKRFGIKQALISDLGVKEGYLKMATKGIVNVPYLPLTED